MTPFRLALKPEPAQPTTIGDLKVGDSYQLEGGRVGHVVAPAGSTVAEALARTSDCAAVMEQLDTLHTHLSLTVAYKGNPIKRVLKGAMVFTEREG